MKLRTLFIVIPFVLAYSMLNFIFLSTEEEYTSMSDYIESTKNEFSYDIQEVIYDQPLVELLNDNLNKISNWLIAICLIFLVISMLLINRM